MVSPALPSPVGGGRTVDIPAPPLPSPTPDSFSRFFHCLGGTTLLAWTRPLRLKGKQIPLRLGGETWAGEGQGTQRPCVPPWRFSPSSPLPFPAMG